MVSTIRYAGDGDEDDTDILAADDDAEEFGESSAVGSILVFILSLVLSLQHVAAGLAVQQPAAAEDKVRQVLNNFEQATGPATATSARGLLGAKCPHRLFCNTAKRYAGIMLSA